MAERELAPSFMRERQRYEQGFLDCRNVQVSIALQEWGIPVEVLYYNAWESTRSIYEHLYVHKKLPWLYESPCLTPSELELIGVPYREIPYATYEDAAAILQALDFTEEAAFFWIVCGESPYVKPEFYGHPQSVHSVWVRGLSSAAASTDPYSEESASVPGYCVRDTFPEFEGFVSEADFCRMIDSPYIKAEDRKAFLIQRPDQVLKVDMERIIERFAERQKILDLSDEAVFYEWILYSINQQEPVVFPDWVQLYYCNSHAFRFLAGSRYAYSCFAAALMSNNHPWVGQLREIARKADMLKNVFLLAAQSGRVDGYAVLRMCRQLQKLEQEWLADGYLELGRTAPLPK
ncbi:hypothetical protein [Paenibacillus alvei]|uniref:Butirosin biosynthesis protein H N-terminal domain-containing protein n=1 Tax=Paenibacillus alvei TaxID=44250 RepID=A0AAP7DLI9_PAEAL|nr:hypothetical protein [Paenibacillus alvei]NOJ73749.1 hypothetical protein [Paenibacillus alvei]